jgi:hypothetical protein
MIFLCALNCNLYLIGFVHVIESRRQANLYRQKSLTSWKQFCDLNLVQSSPMSVVPRKRFQALETQTGSVHCEQA